MDSLIFVPPRSAGITPRKRTDPGSFLIRRPLSPSTQSFDSSLRNTTGSLLWRKPNEQVAMMEIPATTKQGYREKVLKVPGVWLKPQGSKGASARRGILDAGRVYYKNDSFSNEDDPIFALDASVLQLLEEKKIAGRLFPRQRNDARIAIRAHHLKGTDQFRDSPIASTKILGARLLSQGLDSAHRLHANDDIDSLHPKSLCQMERRSVRLPPTSPVFSKQSAAVGFTEFPVAPWEGTNRQIDIGLWREPGWERKPPGDTKRLLRSTTSALLNS